MFPLNARYRVWEPEFVELGPHGRLLLALKPEMPSPCTDGISS